MQQAILELRWGAESGTKRILAPGDRIRVGRKPQAHWIVDDEKLSGTHFEIAYDGTSCEVSDLKSATGTHVGGQKIEAPVAVGNNGWIRAGETDFMVYLEASTPPEDDELDLMLAAEEGDLEPNTAGYVEQCRDELLRKQKRRDTQRAEALSRLEAVEGGLFAVLDASRDERVLTLMRESVETYRSLYEGLEGESLEHVAPYLVSLPKGSSLLRRIVTEGFLKRWAIFIEYPRGFKDLRQHLRRFLMVADADTRRKFYFRFYDPGVLRAFLPTSTPKQRSELFGEITAIYLENDHGRIARLSAEGA